MAARKFLGLVLALALLVGCGNKGPLQPAKQLQSADRAP